jgi:sec-independent protein translocase protein TatA
MVNTILLAGLGGPEIILIIVALLLLFGGKKIPELMRGLGKGVKEFKESQNPDKPLTDEELKRP